MDGTKKGRFPALLAVLIAVIIGVGPVQAAERAITNISLLSTPFGTGSYVLSSALEEIAKRNHPWIRISHSETPGQIFNIKKLDKEPDLKKSTIVTSGPGVGWLAAKGLKPFEEKHSPLPLIANYYSVAVWLATLNPNIKTPNDLAGKKIAFGRIPQIVFSIQPEWVIRHGWGIRDKVKIEYAGMKEAITALLDGLVDAAIVGGYLDPITNKFALSPQTIELMASGRTVYHIPWGKEAVKKTAQEMENSISPYTIPANTMQGQKDPLDVFVDSVAWCVAPEFPEDVAYEITKLILTHYAKFAEYSDLGKLISPQALVFGWDPKDIHKGALKAYKEAGILK